MLTRLSIVSFHSTFWWAILPPGLGCVTESASVRLKVLIFVSNAAAPLPDPVVSLCSPCTILYPLLSHRAFHSLTLSRLPLCSCMNRTSSEFLCAHFSRVLILCIPSSFPFSPLTLKVAILSLSGPSPGYPSVLSIFSDVFSVSPPCFFPI